MYAYIVRVAGYTFPLISLNESHAPHSIAQHIISTRRESPLHAHRYPVRDFIRSAHDEWNVPLVPLEDGEQLTITDHKQGVHVFHVKQGWATSGHPAVYADTDTLHERGSGAVRAAVKLALNSQYARTVDL